MKELTIWRKTSVVVASEPTEIRTGHHPDISQKCCRLSQFLRPLIFQNSVPAIIFLWTRIKQTYVTQLCIIRASHQTSLLETSSTNSYLSLHKSCLILSWITTSSLYCHVIFYLIPYIIYLLQSLSHLQGTAFNVTNSCSRQPLHQLFHSR